MLARQALRAIKPQQVLSRGRNMCTAAVEATEKGPLSLSRRENQELLALIGSLYVGMGFWNMSTKKEEAKKAAEHAAHAEAHPEAHAAPVHHEEEAHAAHVEVTPVAPVSVVTKVVMAASLPANPAEWKVAHVTKWLDDLELPQLAQSFTQQSVNGTLLLCLNEAELHQELSVKSSLHRKKILMAIGDLRKAYVNP